MTPAELRSYRASWAVCFMVPVILVLRLHNGSPTTIETFGFWLMVMAVCVRKIIEQKRKQSNALPSAPPQT